MSAHLPVMLPDVLEALQPADGETFVDGTFGAGGYSRALLQAAHCKVFAIDQDPDVQAVARALAQEFPGRFAFIAGRFGDMCALLAREGVERVDGVVLDIGVSSMQIDQPARGFSFRSDGPLDMRMSQQGRTAADVLNHESEEAIADILYHYGEERASRRIARAIVEARPLTRTKQLAEIVQRVVRVDGKKDPATRTFQALRVYLNDELGELTRALHAAEQLLKPGGRLVVVTFHSLEDRQVKRFLHLRAGKHAGWSRHVPVVHASDAPSFRLHTPEKRVANDAEIQANPRARSATLRAASRTDAPLWRDDA